MFPNIYALPGPEHQRTGAYGDGQINRGEGRPDVGRHVILTLRRVNKERVAIRNEPIEKGVQITPDIRVGILLDEQRCGSVAQMQGKQTRSHALGRDPLPQRAGKLVKAAPTGLNSEFTLGLTQHT